MTEYHVSSDGSHRTLWATLVGADYLELEYTPQVTILSIMKIIRGFNLT